MKRFILSLLMAAAFLFAGFDKANAQVVVTLNSFNSPGINGLAYNPLSNAIPIPAIYGFSLTGTGSGANATISSITLKNPTTGTSPNYNEVQTSIRLWSSPTSTFNTSTATQLSSVNVAANSTTTTFTPGTALSIAAGSVSYYFVTYNANAYYATTYGTTEQDYLSNTGSVTIAAGAQTTGYRYTESNGPAAPTITAGNNNTGAVPASNTTIYPAAATNLAVAGISLTASAASNVSNLTFAYTTTSGTYNAAFGTPKLYSSSSNTFSGTATPVTTSFTTVGASTISFDLPNPTAFSTTATYYYLVVNYTTAVNSTFTFTPSSYTTSSYNDKPVAVSYTPANSYICGVPGPYVLTLRSLTNAASSSGLVATPVPYPSTNYSVYGFSLAGSGTVAGTSTISSLTFHQGGSSTDPDNLYYGTATLYSSTNPAFQGVGNAASTQIGSPIAADGTTNIVFPVSISANNSTNLYYFIVLNNTLGDANTNSFQLMYTSSIVTGTAITAATGTPGVTGPAYTFKPVPQTTVTINSIGASGGAPANGLVSDPISTFQSGIAIFGFTLTGSGSGTNAMVNSLTFNTSFDNFENNNTFFPTLTLYSSTNPIFQGVGNSQTSSSLGSVTLGANLNNIVISPTAALTVTSSTTASIYYFLVADYTTLAASYANNDFEMDNYSGTTVAGAAINIGTYDGWDYTFTPPTINATNIIMGLSPAPPANIYQGQSGLAVAGMGLSISMGTSTISKIAFTDNQTRTTSLNYFNATPQLYVSTSPVFSLTTGTIATLVPSTVAIGTGAAPVAITFTITTPQNITTTTLYYYMVLNYSATGGAVPLTFQFAPYSYTSAVNGTAYPGFYPGTVNSYTCSPPVFVAASSTNGFAGTTIVAVAPTQALFGFSLSSQNALTFTTFSFTSTGSVGTISNNFANLVLYSSSTNDFTTATPVTPGYLINSLSPSSPINSTSFVISNLSESLSNSTKYYFVVLDVTAIPAAGTVTFTPTLASVATSSTTYSTATYGLTVPGQTYTLKQPAPATYYWTGKGTNTDWRNASNWQTNTTVGSYANTGAYPGATTSDVANFNSQYFYSYINNTGLYAEGVPAINAYNITVSAVNISDFTYAALTVNSGYSLTTGILTINSPTNDQAELGITGTLATGTTPVVNITGATTLGTGCELYLSAAGSNINFGPSSTTTINGSANYPSYIYADGGIMTTTSGAMFTLAGAYSNIEFGGGTMTSAGTTFNLTGNYSYLATYGGTMNFTAASIVNATAIGTVNKPHGLYLSSGTITTDASTINLGTTNANGSKAMIYNFGGTFTAGNSSVINLNGPNTLITANGTGVYNNINSSTINLGTSAISGSGSGATISNVSNSTIYLNANSVINMIGATTALTNNGGIFVAASTSFINPTSTSATISNPNVASTSNYFTLLSDANGSATIGQLGVGAKVTGQFNVQRYISAASRNYRLLSSATNSTAYTPGSTLSPNQVNMSLVTTSATLPTTPVVNYPGAFTGGPAGTGGGFTATTGGPTMYLYQESIVPSLTNYNASYYSGKNIAITSLLPTYETTVSTANAVGGMGAIGADNASTVIVGPGNGYLLFYIHNNATNVATTPINTTQTTASGFINQGTIPLVLWGQSGFLTTSLTNNGVLPATNPHALAGFTMVGNPYPSTIDLQQLYKDNTGASAVFTNGAIEYFNTLDPTNTQFVSYGYDGTNVYTSSGTNFSRYIASGEGFYITVQKANQGLTFYEDQKVATAPSVVVENIPVTNPANTVDNVNTGNVKTADAVVLPASNSQTADAATPSTGSSRAPVSFTHANMSDLSTSNNFTTSTVARTIKAGTESPDIVPPITLTVNNLPAPANTPPPTISSTGTPVTLTDLHLKLVMDSVDYDECGLYFSKTGLDKYEANDALDMDGTSGKVYLSSYTSDNLRTGINSLGDYTPGKRVKLYVRFSADGIYQLQLEDLKGFNTNQYSIFLIDNLKKDSLDLTLYKSYNFNYAVSDTASYHTRFVLAIEHKPVPYYALTAFAGEKVTSGVQLSWSTKNESNTTKFVLQKLTGTNTYTFLDSLSSDSSGTYAYVDAHPTLGNNIYRLQQTDGLGNVTYSAPITIGYNSTSPNGGLVVYPNPTKSTMTVTLNTSSITSQVTTADIYDIHGTRVEHKSVNSNSFVYDASSYKLGVYIIELKNSNGVLVGKSKFVKVQ